MLQPETNNAAPLYRFSPLGRERIDMAYPLVRDTCHPVTLNQWRAYAQTILDGAENSGLIIAETPATYIRGIFAYHVRPDLPAGNRLDFDCIAVPEAFDRRAIAHALIKEFNTMAQRLNCEGVVTLLRHEHAWLDPFFRATGYSTSETHSHALERTAAAY